MVSGLAIMAVDAILSGLYSIPSPGKLDDLVHSGHSNFEKSISHMNSNITQKSLIAYSKLYSNISNELS